MSDIHRLTPSSPAVTRMLIRQYLALVLFLCCFQPVARCGDVALLSLEIHELDIDDATFEQAVNIATKTFATEHPEVGFVRHAIISKQPNASIKIDLHLKDIPLGVALDFIASAGFYAWRIYGNAVLFTDHQVGENAITTYPVVLDDSFKKKFDLAGDINSEGFGKLLATLRLQKSSIQMIHYSSKSRVLLVQGRISEVELLKAAVEFSQRGLILSRE